MRNGKAIIAQDFINLKNRIKNEVKRRNKVGSVEAYGSPSYDYVETPSQFETIKTEHMSKITECVGAINDTNVNRSSVNGDTITKLAVIDAEITRFEAAPIVGDNSGCRASCTGLCTTSCSGTCTSGCSGGCTGTCSGCSGGCSGSCSGGCSGCGGSCGYGCSAACASYCGGTCTGGEFCSGGCSGCCTGCSSSCASSCSSSSSK